MFAFLLYHSVNARDIRNFATIAVLYYKFFAETFEI